jgi:hypothetical protein
MKCLVSIIYPGRMSAAHQYRFFRTRANRRWSKNGELQKHKGVWRGSIEGEPVHGNTVANLCRDGLFVATKGKQSGSARLTERGEWFVRALIAAEADHLIGQFQRLRME